VRRSTRAAWAALGLCSAALAAPLGAQTLGWSGTAEASGNLFFGAARGRLASLAAGAARADSGLEVRADALLTYADARDEDGVASVTARATRVSLALDARPFARLSPFAFGGAETSLQQRVALRVSGGAGAKRTFYRHGDDDVSFSLALLGERTRVLHPEPGAPTDVSRARWSARLRVRRQLGAGLRVTHVTFYQPAVDRVDRYVVDSQTALALTLTKVLAATVTLRDRYDSEATARGARSDHDGQVVFGLRATF
jgi:hypothetical protein